jgi:hypothetical protein
VADECIKNSGYGGNMLIEKGNTREKLVAMSLVPPQTPSCGKSWSIYTSNKLKI